MSKDVIIEMFQWSWNSVAAECTSFIGPAGYGYVQVSPAQEAIPGAEWSTSYSPVSYILDSKLGTRDEYSTMVQTCHDAGTKVLADVVTNHMSGGSSGNGVTAGSPYSYFDYPAVPWTTDNFHYCDDGDNNLIDDYTNRTNVQDCELDGLADLYTDSEPVRARLVEYLNDLMSLGIDGFRFDAVTWIAADDLANITSRLTAKPSYLTQEVHWIEDCPILPSEYTSIGGVQEFRYVTALTAAFSGSSSSISELENLDSMGWVEGDEANVFVATHDTERDGTGLTSSSPSDTYVTAHVFSLAHPYGTPTVLSSYSFDTITDGAPNENDGVCSGSGGSDGWLCQHRWTAIAGMVGFHNVAGDAAISNWYSPTSQQIAFSRGSVAYVAINNEDQPWNAAFNTGLPTGLYCDVVHGQVEDTVCTSPVYFVDSSGIANITVPPRGAIGVHFAAVITASTVVEVTFNEVETTSSGDNVYLVGSISQLAAWATSDALPMTTYGYPTWSTTVYLPASTSFEYKFIKVEEDGTIVWEDDPNRTATTPSSGTLVLSDSWQ